MYLLVFYYLFVFNTNKMVSINKFYFFKFISQNTCFAKKKIQIKMIYFKIGEEHETLNLISIIFKTSFWQRS